ncbi:hypothetical protein, partial [Pseudomonas sp.]|uniref:hypothetical protein n=1 Tax=Pseudomonas sp. TaxID=306 RepID=UPI00238DCCF8
KIIRFFSFSIGARLISTGRRLSVGHTQLLILTFSNSVGLTVLHISPRKRGFLKIKRGQPMPLKKSSDCFSGP